MKNVDDWCVVDYGEGERERFWMNAFLEFVRAGHGAGAAIAYSDEALVAFKRREQEGVFLDKPRAGKPSQ